MNGPTKKGEWITNFPRSIKGLKKRKAAVVEGDPKASESYSVEQLKAMKLIGVYLDEDIPEGYYSRDFV